MTSSRPWHAGIDIGGTQVRLATGHTDGKCRPVLRAAMPDTYSRFLGLISDLIARAKTTSAAGLAGAPAAVASGLPGTSDGERPVFVPALPWLEGKPLAADLGEVFGAPVTLAVDGHLTLLAEACEGAARGRRSAVLVAVGTGIGGALMVGGRIWRGQHGSAGAWGWLPHGADATRRVGASGLTATRHGEFELGASGTALDVRANALGVLSAQALVTAARAGDGPASAVVREYAAELARGLAALASTLDPEIILIGGGLSAAMDVLRPVIGQTMALAASPDGRRVPVRAAALGPDAGVIGAWHAARGGANIWL